MTVGTFLTVVRRRWLTVVACLLAGALVAIAVTRNSPKRYASSTRLFIDIPAAADVAQALQGVQLSQQLIASYAEIATSQLAVSQIVQKLHLTEGPSLSATAVPGTLLVEIKAVQSSPELARGVAATAGAELISQISEFNQGRASPVTARTIDQASLNSGPIAPRPKRNLEEGVALGLVIGLLAAFGLESLDRSIKEPSDVQKLTGAPLLGMLPFRRGGIPASLMLEDREGGPAVEAFRSLRTSVRFLEIDQPLRTIVVTSPSSGEGKSTVATNLALAMAEAGERVVLVDADLRRGRLGEVFEVETDPGLTSVVIGATPVAKALRRIGPHLALLPTGTFPPNPSELLGSARAAQVFDYLRANADVVIIDAPPALPVTDAVVLSTQVDGVIVVLRSGRTRRDAAAEAHRRLDVIGANVVGCVLNSVSSRASYGVYESYRYERPPRRRPAPPIHSEPAPAPMEEPSADIGGPPSPAEYQAQAEPGEAGPDETEALSPTPTTERS